MIRSKSIIFSICTLFILSACNNKKQHDPFADFNPYDGDLGKRIEAYQDAKFPNLSKFKNRKTSFVY